MPVLSHGMDWLYPAVLIKMPHTDLEILKTLLSGKSGKGTNTNISEHRFSKEEIRLISALIAPRDVKYGPDYCFLKPNSYKRVPHLLPSDILFRMVLFPVKILSLYIRTAKKGAANTSME